MSGALLTIQDVAVELPTPRGNLRAVDRVNLTLEAGRTLGIVGESGCGKTMLSRAILQLLPKKAKLTGRVMFAGQDLARLDPESLRQLLYELPYPRQAGTRVSEPCPLSARELDVLRHLSEGMVYKQIAGEMQLSVSTIRTHLHNVYGKIGAVDRAQAVLAARDRGWI